MFFSKSDSHGSHVAKIEATLTQFAAANSPKTVLIFDFDETLCHLHLPWGEYVAEVSEYLRTVDTELFDTLIRQHDLAQVLNQFVKIYGDAVWEKERRMALVFETSRLEKAPLNFPALKWIAANQDTYTFVIWSSNCVPTIKSALGSYKEYFKPIVGKDVVTFTKPQAEGFTKIRQELAHESGFDHQILDFETGDFFTSSSFLMIGNNLIDDKGAAEQAGIDFLHLHFTEG